MEAAGLAIGAVPILIELFKQTIDAYKLFLEGRKLEKTVSHLGVRLDIEERRLVQWGESSGFSPDDTRPSSTFGTDTSLFRNRALHTVIEKVLRCIIDIFGDVAGLQKKYGLDISGNSDAVQVKGATTETEALQIEASDTVVSGKRKLAESFSIRKQVKIAYARFQWAIKDKEQFEKLLADLRYYNDSLYDLHHPNLGASITRDTLASIIQSADTEALRSMRSLRSPGPTSLTAPGIHSSLYPNVSPSAGIALQQRAPEKALTAPYMIPAHEISFMSYDREGNSQLEGAVWRRPELEPVPIILENIAELEREGRGALSLHAFLQTAQRLASLLTYANSEPTFRTLEFLGILNHKYPAGTKHVALVYKKPPGSDHSQPPVSLKKFLERSLRQTSLPQMALDDRLDIARSLLHATFQLHSSKWMHKHMSPEVVVFFERQNREFPENRPRDELLYVHGFTPSSRVGFTLPVMDEIRSLGSRGFRAGIGRHPSYLFHRALKGRPKRTFYRFRHDYYSLGLMLLEIGLWTPLLEMEPIAEAIETAQTSKAREERSLWQPTSISSMVDTLPSWKPVSSPTLDSCLNQLLDMASTDPTTSSPTRPRTRDAVERLMQCIRDVRQSTREEQMQDVVHFETLEETTESADLDFKVKKDYTFWDSWVRTDIYLNALCRREAIRIAESALASTMGRRYQNVVLRCLKSDFDIPFTANEADWLKAFNWLAVNEIDKLCL